MTRRIFKTLPPVDPELERLLELARNAPPMTSEEREAQRRSFAYGNCAIDNPTVTRKVVDRAADELVRRELSSHHLGHHHGPVHPNILKYEVPK